MITKDDVVKAARLARISLRDDEIARIAAELVRIVGHVEQIATVDIDGVSPMVQPFDVEGARRDDVVSPVKGRDAVAQSAGYDDGLVRVPKVVE